MKAYLVEANGTRWAVRAPNIRRAADLIAGHLYPAQRMRASLCPGAPNTARRSVYDLGDQSRVLITLRAPDARRVEGGPEGVTPMPPLGGVIFPTSAHSVRLDEPTVATLRALGGGNLSLGVRRAAALLGGAS